MSFGTLNPSSGSRSSSTFANLPVTACVGRISSCLSHNPIAQARILAETFDASGYCYLPYENLGVAAITVEPSAELKSFQEMVIEAISPLVVNSGDGSAFVSPADGTEINQLTIDYVKAYVPDYSGTQFNPHVTVGIANQKFLDDLIAEPFEAFSFKARSVSIYQLGNFGAAQKMLRSFG